jgi:hypothetical protein
MVARVLDFDIPKCSGRFQYLPFKKKNIGSVRQREISA